MATLKSNFDTTPPLPASKPAYGEVDQHGYVTQPLGAGTIVLLLTLAVMGLACLARLVF